MIARRIALRMAAGGLAAGVAPALLAAPRYRSIPQKPSARVIIDNDFAGDPDGLVALIHQLLHPKSRSVLITSSALEPKFAPGPLKTTSAAEGGKAALELIRRARLHQAPPIAVGRELGSSAAGGPSPAAKAIVAEAMRDDPLPLVFTCGGPLTNLADALALEPRIAGRMKLIWIGGGDYPTGGWEYNLATDGQAARSVIELSQIPLWQVPQGAYRQMAYSVAAMRDQLRTISPFGAWLYDRFTSPPEFVDLSGSWPLGDSPLVLLSAITTESSRFTDRKARRIAADFSYGAEIPGRSVRVFETLDARLTFDDFFALMRLHARGELAI